MVRVDAAIDRVGKARQGDGQIDLVISEGRVLDGLEVKMQMLFLLLYDKSVYQGFINVLG